MDADWTSPQITTTVRMQFIDKYFSCYTVIECISWAYHFSHFTFFLSQIKEKSVQCNYNKGGKGMNVLSHNKLVK